MRIYLKTHNLKTQFSYYLAQEGEATHSRVAAQEEAKMRCDNEEVTLLRMGDEIGERRASRMVVGKRGAAGRRDRKEATPVTGESLREREREAMRGRDTESAAR